MANEEWLVSLDAGMIESVERAEAGFYFEEGGCWAMAQALYLEMKAQGMEPRIHVRKEGFVHAWVTVDGIDFDWQGRFTAKPGYEPVPTLSELRDLAREYGHTCDMQFESDVAWATSIVKSALEVLH